MPAALITALVFSVIPLVIAAYFLMGSVPLLILKHDTPLDARFVGGFFTVYFAATTYAALATAASHALAGKPALAVGAAVLALLAFDLRRVLVPQMAALLPRIQAQDAAAIRAFRRRHASVILINVLQLVVMVWSLIRLSMDMR